MAKKQKIPRTRNAGTWTEAAFWNWLRSSLRRMSIYWKPIVEVKKEARVLYTGPNKRRKYSYMCAKCKQEFDDKSVDVHHLQPCGSLKSFNDLSNFAERLFVEKDMLVLLCKNCHKEYHNND